MYYEYRIVKIEKGLFLIEYKTAPYGVWHEVKNKQFKTKPKAEISSTTKCLNEKDLEKEAKSHGLVVLPENLINRFDIISKLSTETRSKLEVIVNSACPLNCMARKKHYDYMSRIALKEKVPKFVCPNYNYAGNGFLYELFNTPQFVSNKMINKYIKLGINHFKIQGRTDSDYNLIETFAYYLVKEKYRIMFRELVQQ